MKLTYRINLLIRILLSLLLFGCLMNFPYGYYQLTRFLCFIGFGILAFESKEKKVVFHAIIFACLSFLFQPFYKISLGRELWNVVDVVVGVALILSIFQLNKVSQNN